MKNLQVVSKIKSDIEQLQRYVDLVESFQPETLEEQIIKEYSYIGSVEKVAIKVNDMGYSNEGQPFEKEDISNIIKSKPSNELHKLIRSGFLKKTRHTRRKTEKFNW